MRLAGYLAARGLLPMDAAPASSLSVIRAFLFGEEYTVEMALDGKIESFRFDSLDDALDVMVSEFRRETAFMPDIQIVDYAKTRSIHFGTQQAVGGEKPNVKLRYDDKLDALVGMMTGATQVPTFGPAPGRVLAVTRVERNMLFPMPPLEAYAEDVRTAVTYFSLTGNWDQLDGRSNL